MSQLPEHFVNTVEGYTDLNMLEEATEECLRMVERDPDNAELLVYSAGKASMGTSAQIQRLLAPIERYLNACPEDLPVREARAALLSIQNRYDESLADFARVPADKRRYDANWLWFRTLIDAGRKREINTWIKEVWPDYSHKVRSAQFSTYIKFLWDVS